MQFLTPVVMSVVCFRFSRTLSKLTSHALLPSYAQRAKILTTFLFSLVYAVIFVCTAAGVRSLGSGPNAIRGTKEEEIALDLAGHNVSQRFQRQQLFPE